MKIGTNRGTNALIFTTIMLSLTACSEKSVMLAEETKPLAVETPGSIKDITVIKESEAGSSKNKIESTPYEELPEAVKAKITPKPTPTSTGKPPIAEREDTNFSGEMPKDFTPPVSGKFITAGSVIDGDRSFIGYSFTQEWQLVATNIKESMKVNGWECLICQDYIEEKDDELKYFMQMKKGSKTVNIGITVDKGKTYAGYNFRP
jgi:hypothetical protein